MRDNSWREVTSWFKVVSDTASVEIKHWALPSSPKDSPLFREEGHRWNIYAYLHKGDPKYVELESDDYSVLPDFPFHGGCTFAEMVNGTLKVGCDYNHLGDDYFRGCVSLPVEITMDAQELIEYLTEGEDNVQGEG